MGADRANSHCILFDASLAILLVILTVLVFFVFLVFYAIFLHLTL